MVFVVHTLCTTYSTSFVDVRPVCLFLKIILLHLESKSKFVEIFEYGYDVAMHLFLRHRKTDNLIKLGSKSIHSK